MITNAQEKIKLESENAAQSTGNVATVAAVSSQGIKLILPGQTTATNKYYPFNSSASFTVGQRCHIAREGNTIIVEYPISGGVNIES